MSLPRTTRGALSLVFPSWLVSGKRLVMVKLYLDESGHEDSTPVFAVGGYIAPEENWTALEAEWQPLLDPHHLPFFRMNACLVGHKPFEGMSERQRHRLAELLINVINRHAVIGLGTFVVVKDFKEIMQPAHRMMTHGAPTGRFPPVSFCLRVALEHIALAITRNSTVAVRKREIVVIIEQGGKWQPQALAYCNWLMEHPRWCSGIYASMVPGDKRLPGLQAADILANRTYAAAMARDAGGRVRPDKWLLRLKQLQRKKGSLRSKGYFAIRTGGRHAMQEIIAALNPWYNSVRPV